MKKKITTKNKIRVAGDWDETGIEIYWHQKSDYIFSLMPKSVVPDSEIEPLGKFGHLNIPLKIIVEENGVFNLGDITGFDYAILKIKLEQQGIKEYKFEEEENIKRLTLTSDGDKAMFMTYFSEFLA